MSVKSSISILSRSVRPVGTITPISTLVSLRGYATKGTPSKKKNNSVADISQIPIKSIGTIADFYVPPKFSACPITSWPRLLLRRLAVFGVNTYSIVKFRQETKLKLRFNDWKEEGMSKFVKANKIFAAACNLPMSKRKEYLSLQLEGNTGSLVTQQLIERANTFPNNGKITWELLSVAKNPKIVSFTILPDSNNVTTYVQLVVKASTKQRVTFSDGVQQKSTEKVVTDNLVFSLNPFSDELVLVGTIFDSNHIRGVQPEISFQDTKLMQQFQKQTADIFRSNPNSK